MFLQYPDHLFLAETAYLLHLTLQLENGPTQTPDTSGEQLIINQRVDAGTIGRIFSIVY